MHPPFDVATATAAPRTRSEDRVEIFTDGEAIVLVVADGVGVQAGGAVASDAVVRAVRARLARSDAPGFGAVEAARVLEAVDADLARRFAGESTAVIVRVGDDGVAGASVGDSEAWIVDGTRVDRLTDAQERRRVGSVRARPMTFERSRLDGVMAVGSDGLFACTTVDAIVRACRGRPASEVAQALVDVARLPSGALRDDVAIAVCRSIGPTEP